MLRRTGETLLPVALSRGGRLGPLLCLRRWVRVLGCWLLILLLLLLRMSIRRGALWLRGGGRRCLVVHLRTRRLMLLAWIRAVVEVRRWIGRRTRQVRRVGGLRCVARRVLRSGSGGLVVGLGLLGEPSLHGRMLLLWRRRL